MNAPKRGRRPVKHKGLAPRAAALATLSDVLTNRRPLTDAAKDKIDGANPSLSGQDKTLARAIAYAALRHLGAIDEVLSNWLKKPLPVRSGETKNIIRIALAEIAFLRTPAYAAGSTATTLADMDLKARHFKDLINALVRRAGRELDDVIADVPSDVALPGWLYQTWVNTYGADETHAMISQLMVEAPLDITVKEPDRLDHWQDRLGAERLETGTLRLHKWGPVESLPGFEEGAWWVQDGAAALPARLANAKPGQTVADLCAAPGGKTLQLAATGATVFAVDRAAQRLKLIEANLKRTGLSAICEAADASQWRPAEPVDTVLLDAPCTATGTIRRHPDLPWIKDASDARALSEIQRDLLLHASEIVKPGGQIIYSVCSLEPLEGEELIASVLAATPQLSLSPIEAGEISGIAPFLSEAGTLRTLPSHWREKGGLDGFFAARLTKII